MDDPPPSNVGKSYTFGPFRLVPERRLLLRNGAPVRIGGRAFDLLVVLVERSGEIVGKRELMALVWSTLFVEEGNLKVNMNALRRALGEAPDANPYVATVIGRGYRFVAAVTVDANADVGTVGAGSRASNLPTATTRIVGRQSVIDAIHHDLRDARIVSILGPGGIGKTTVALAIAEGEIARHRDGVWLVDLSPLTDPGLVPNAIATAIGLAAHSANMLEALCHYLRDRNMLLVLDSCEHLVEAVGTCVDRIVAASSNTIVLVTSREPLRVRGERVRRLPGLATPANGIDLTAVDALSFPAIQLFVDRAIDRDEAFALSDADAPDAAEICRRLDGLALAIELAATNVEALGVAGLLHALENRFGLLEGRRGGPERHRTLLATIDWSYHLLSPAEQSLMRKLSVFAGSFNLNSACAIAMDTHLDRPAITADLARLVTKSLVAAEVHDSGIEYRQLDSTRAYALEKLAESGELDPVRRRHAEHCIDLLGSAKADIERQSRTDWLTRHAGKLDDIRTALHWAFENAHELGVRLTAAAIPFGKQLSLIEEFRIVVERALDDRLAPYRSARDDLLLNLTLGATLLHSRGPMLAVKRALTKALAIAEDLGDIDLQLECLRGLSEFELWTGDSRSAIAVSERIGALQSKGQKAAAGDADAQAGSALHWLGALGAARHRLESIVQKPFVAEHRPDAMRFEFDQRLTARGALATVLWLQGFPDQALAIARQQLEDAEASNYAVSLCSALLHGSAMIAMYVRDYAAARSFMDRGVEHARRHGLTIWTAMVTGGSARLSLYLGQQLDLAHLRDNLAEVREGGFRLRYPNYLTNFGEALARQGDLQGGLAAIDEAIAICRDTGQVVGIPEILRIKGNVVRFEDPDRWESAADLYRQSIEVAQRDFALSWELRSAISLVKLWRLHGGNQAAEDGLAMTLGRFTEGFGTVDLRRARALVDSRTD